MTADGTQCGGCAVGDALTRRDFLSMAAVSAAAIALAGCGGGSDTPTGTTGGVGTVQITLADYPQLATVGATAKVRNSPPVAISRVAAGSAGLVAFSLSCTHQSTLTNINTDFSITCPNHGAQFTSAGVWRGGQPTTNLVRLPITVDSGNAIATVTLG